MVLLPGATQRLFNYMYLSSPDGSTPFAESAGSYITFISGVLGAVMVGWSVTLLCVLYGPFRRGQAEGWRTFALALVAWFVPDTSFSLWSGFWQNAVLNAIILLLFAVPLAATYKSARDSGKMGTH
jgi:hypothetical protein